ncbi:uncharacterized protein LOC142659841 [Rhinoderma darwinii]|uniref:uncharacterized protein LOC142659841 n=1 Tax=Rhinoderma darwinii TaxID=43563 RepID=UPI003F668FF6
MSGYSRRRVAIGCVIEPAVHKQKKAKELRKGRGHGKNKCDQGDIQPAPQAPMCDVQNIQLSGICSLSQSSYNYNSSLASTFDESRHVQVVERTAGPNDYKLLSEIDVECKSLDPDTVSISSNESDCDIQEVGAWISEKVSKTPAQPCPTKGDVEGEKRNQLSSYLTKEGNGSNEPKLSVSPTVSPPMSKLKRMYVETNAQVDFIKNAQYADSFQLNKARKVLDVTQTLSTLSSIQNDTGELIIQSKQNKLPRNKPRSVVYPKQTGIDKLTRISDVQRESSSPLIHSAVPSHNQSNHDPDKSMRNELSNKEYCCVLSWSANIHGKQLQCPCSFAADTSKPGLGSVAGSSTVINLALEQESYKYRTNTVQKETTSRLKTQDQLRLPLKNRQGSSDKPEQQIQNEKKTQAYILWKRSRVARSTSQAFQLSKGENSNPEEERQSILNSVLKSKTLRTCKKNGGNILDSQEKAQHADIQLYNKKVKSMSMDSDIVSLSSNDSDMEKEVSVPETVRKEQSKFLKRKSESKKQTRLSTDLDYHSKVTGVDRVAHEMDLPEQSISQKGTRLSPVTNGNICNDTNIHKADQNKNRLNTDHLQLNAKKNGGIVSDKTRKVLDVGQDHMTSPSLKNDREKNSVQSEQNKFAMNVHPKQTNTLTKEANLHTKRSSVCYKDRGPESPKKICRFLFKVRDKIGNDRQATTFVNKVVQNTQLEEQNALQPENKFGSNDKKLLNVSAERVTSNIRSVACNEMFSKVEDIDSLTSGIKMPKQTSASLDVNTEQRSQSVSLGDREYPFNSTDHLSEIITASALDIHSFENKYINTDSSSENKDSAIDRCLDNLGDLIKQFDEEYKSLLGNNRSNDVCHSAMPSDELSNDKTEREKQEDTCSKEFCCILGWSAYVSGEQSKCLCTSVSDTTNSGVNEERKCSRIHHVAPELESSKDDFALIKDLETKTNTVEKGTESTDQPSRSPPSHIREKRRKKSQTKNINSEGKCEFSSVSEMKALTKRKKSKRNKKDKKKKVRKSDILQRHKGKSKPPSSDMVDDTKDLEQCNSSLPYVKTQGTQPGVSEPGSSNKSIKTFASPILNVNIENICNKKERGRKNSKLYADHSQLYLTKVQQNPLTQVCKNLFVKDRKDKNVSSKKTIASTLPRNPDLDLQSNTESFISHLSTGILKDGSSSGKRDNVCSLPKKYVNVPAQTSKEVWPLHPEHQHKLPNDMTRPRKKKRSSVPGHSSKRGRPAKSNRSLELNVSEQTISSPKASERCSSPMKDMRGFIFFSKNKSNLETSTKCIHNFDISIQDFEKKQLMKSCPNRQVKDISSSYKSIKKSVATKKSVTTFNTRETSLDLETLTGSKRRPVEAGQELSKDHYTFGKKVKKNISNVVKQNGKDFHFQEIVSENNDKSKQQTPSKEQINTTGSPKTRSTSRRRSHNPGLRKQNISSVETTDAPPPSVSGFKYREDREVKSFQNTHKGSSCIPPNMTPSRRHHRDLQTKTVSPIGRLDTQLQVIKLDRNVVTKSSDETTPAVRETKCNDKYKKSGQKPENKHDLGDKGKKQTARHRKRKASNPESERSRSKKRKSAEKKPTCPHTKDSSLALDLTAGCLLTHIDVATVSSRGDASVVQEVIEAGISNQDTKCIIQVPNEQSQNLSYLKNKHNFNYDSKKQNLKKQKREANVLRDKRNQNSHEPGHDTETLSYLLPVLKNSVECQTDKVYIKRKTKSMESLQCHLEKGAPPTSDTAVKTLDASRYGRPIDQSTPKEKTYVKQCVLKLCRLPLPLQRPFLLDNTRVTCKAIKMEGKADTGKREK